MLCALPLYSPLGFLQSWGRLRQVHSGMQQVRWASLNRAPMATITPTACGRRTRALWCRPCRWRTRGRCWRSPCRRMAPQWPVWAQMTRCAAEPALSQDATLVWCCNCLVWPTSMPVPSLPNLRLDCGPHLPEHCLPVGHVPCHCVPSLLSLPFPVISLLQVSIWAVDVGVELVSLSAAIESHPLFCAFSADGAKLAVTESNGSVMVWNAVVGCQW